ncbi:MAG: hypothetical protein RXR43_05545 [Sulfolobus sp.]
MTIKAKPLIFTFFVVLALASAVSVSYTPKSLFIPQGSNTFTFANGKIYLGTVNGIFSLENNSYILTGYDIKCLAFLDGFYFITFNGSLYFYNGTIMQINIPLPQRLFVDNYTGELYVVANYQYVYVIKGTQVVKSYFIYESFGFLTFTNSYAIVDSQEGYTFLYYNGSNRTVCYYLDALTAMTFANNTFISGSFSPNGLWVFNNLSVLDLSVIPVNYFSQLPYYNIDYVPLPFTPYWIYYSNGLVYVAGEEGYEVLDSLNGYQVIYSNFTPVLQAIGYNGTFYLLTKYGLVEVKLQPPPIYVLTLKEIGLPSYGIFTVEINGQEYTSTNGSITLKLAGDVLYNITFKDYMGFRPNVTSIELNLTSNTNLSVRYTSELVKVTVDLVGVKNGTHWVLYVDGTPYNESSPIAYLYLSNSTTYFINVSVPNYKVFPVNLEYQVNGNSTLVFTATPILVENTSTATSSTSTAFSFTNPSYEFYILLAIFSVIVIFFFIYIIRGVRKSV